MRKGGRRKRKSRSFCSAHLWFTPSKHWSPPFTPVTFFCLIPPICFGFIISRNSSSRPLMPQLNETLSRRSVTSRKFNSSSDCTRHWLSIIDQSLREEAYWSNSTCVSYQHLKSFRSVPLVTVPILCPERSGYGLQWCISGGSWGSSQPAVETSCPPHLHHICDAVTLQPSWFKSWNKPLEMLTAEKKMKNLKWGLYAFELFFPSGTKYADCNTFMLVNTTSHIFLPALIVNFSLYSTYQLLSFV